MCKVTWMQSSEVQWAKDLACCFPINDERTHMPNNKNWEEIYELILKDIVVVVEDSSKGADRKIDRITEILVGNDFMEKPSLY